jgi:hypothetical protein
MHASRAELGSAAAFAAASQRCTLPCPALLPRRCISETRALPTPPPRPPNLQALPEERAARERALLFWHLEDCLKRRYALLVTALEEASRDNLDFIKERATK